ncbi:MAG: hypothetical protein AAFX01_01410 [Cyanobacteria bacterium J06638_28]
MLTNRAAHHTRHLAAMPRVSCWCRLRKSDQRPLRHRQLLMTAVNCIAVLGLIPTSVVADETPLQLVPEDLTEPVLPLREPILPHNEGFTLEDDRLEPESTASTEGVLPTETVETVSSESMPWRATVWGGVMTDNALGPSLIGQDIRLEDSALLGLGVSRRLAGGNSIKVEGELQLLQHLGQQDHLEGTAALALRWEMSSRFSVAVIEGISYATAIPEIEAENNDRAAQLLNYLAFEAEYAYTPQWAIATRLHHRSGVGGLFSDVKGGSNAYLVGIRRRF